MPIGSGYKGLQSHVIKSSLQSACHDKRQCIDVAIILVLLHGGSNFQNSLSSFFIDGLLLIANADVPPFPQVLSAPASILHFLFYSLSDHWLFWNLEQTRLKKQLIKQLEIKIWKQDFVGLQ